MIVFSPPVTKPYAPSTQPIAKVAVGVQFDEGTKRVIPLFTLLDPNGRKIIIDPNGLPQSQINSDQLAAFAAELSVAGQTLAQDIASRSLAILQTCYGLSGGTIE